ncbi:hypothetical protein ACWIG2_20595 [Streptomyces cellulosae]|uniref:Uncharacterized protein n=1 Tax=Streptomyces cellulosae TaxID=1968 RepID=A0ABW6JQV5_STRCE|nr:hypothetical protein [Streptomyces sp. AC04842]GHE46778.1 hypothetical protein GCM10018771_29710 [Streptomyces cellulosae]
MHAGLERPDTGLERDSWLVADGERLVAFGLLWDPSGGERSATRRAVAGGCGR